MTCCGRRLLGDVLSPFAAADPWQVSKNDSFSVVVAPIRLWTAAAVIKAETTPIPQGICAAV
jgi:hypothetical protein